VRCRPLRRAQKHLGRRGAILLSYGFVWSLIGYGQITSPVPDRRGLKVLLDVMPLHVWGWCWIIAGLVAAVSAFLPQGRDAPGFVALVLIVLPWMLGYLLSWWPLGLYPRGWIAAALYGALTLPVVVVAGWREPPRLKRAEPPYEC